MSQARTSLTDIDVCARAVLRRTCTSPMRTDSADQVKHFRFVAARARRHVLEVFTRARILKPARNARCVDRSSTNADDSSRAVANTRDVARFDATRHVRERTAHDEKEIFLAARFCAVSRRVVRALTRFGLVHTATLSHAWRASEARLHTINTPENRLARVVVCARRATRDGSSALRVRANHGSRRAETIEGASASTRALCHKTRGANAGRRNVADATKPGTESRA